MDAVYALLAQEHDRAGLDKWLDEPLPRDQTPEERRLAAMKRAADANREAVANLQRTAGGR